MNSCSKSYPRTVQLQRSVRQNEATCTIPCCIWGILSHPDAPSSQHLIRLHGSAEDVIEFDLDLRTILALHCVPKSITVHTHNLRHLAVELLRSKSLHDDTCTRVENTIAGLERHCGTCGADKHHVPTLALVVVEDLTNLAVQLWLVCKANQLYMAQLREVL